MPVGNCSRTARDRLVDGMWQSVAGARAFGDRIAERLR